MGGVRTKHTGESPTLRGLFAAGEAACWDMHGFNRLGGNSVAETVVAGMIVGEFIADFCESPAGDLDIPTALIREAVAAERARLDVLLHGGGAERADALKIEMQQIMTDKVGIFRSGADLEEAVTPPAGAAGPQPQHRPAPPRGRPEPGAGDGLPHAEDAQGGAVHREGRARPHREPRRALPRGFPAPRRRRLAQAHARDLGGSLRHAAEPVVRAARHLGDGAAARLARLRRQGLRRPPRHAAARRRNSQRLRERLQGADRHRVQAEIMPYEHLLPERFRGLNERIDERLP